ncbi:MAG: acyl carrier protein [Planctomycetaceae bacterium]
MPQPDASTNPELVKRVISIIATESRDRDETKITLESNLQELGVDSFGAVNVVWEVEKEFRVDIPNERLRSLKTVRDIVVQLQGLVSQTQPQPGQ